MTMQDNNQDRDKQFVDSIKSELNESVGNINASDLSVINQARQQALDKKSGQKTSWIFIPAGAIATACLAVVVYSSMQVTPVSIDGQSLVQENQAQENQVQENQVQENQELVSTLEGFDYYEDPEISEELDFLEWLDAYESSS